MKKIISITMAIMLLLSSLFITTAFAKTASADEVVINPNESASSDEVTTYPARPAIPIDPTTPGLDVKTALEIKQTIVDKLSLAEDGLTTDDVTLEYFGTLSDGRVLFRYAYFGMAAPQNVRVYEMGKYIYTASDGFDEVYIYDDHNFYQLKKAYDLGLISDSALEEIAEILNLPLKNEPTSPEEEAPNPQTTPDETKSLSTSDTVGNNNNNNSPIQTGQNASSALAATGIVTLLAAGALLVIRRRFV